MSNKENVIKYTAKNGGVALSYDIRYAICEETLSYILLDVPDKKIANNLFCVDTDGKILWQIEEANVNKTLTAIVQIRLKGDYIYATDSEGNCHQIDKSYGVIVEDAI